MNDSTKTRPARWLRLERLESRSLLAAGLFDFTISDGRQDRDRDTPRQVDDRSADSHMRRVQANRNLGSINQGIMPERMHDHGHRLGDRSSELESRFGIDGNQRGVADRSNEPDPVLAEQFATDSVPRFVSPPLNNPIVNPLTPSIPNSEPSIAFLAAFPIRPSAASQDSGDESLGSPRSNDLVLASLPSTTTESEEAANDGVMADSVPQAAVDTVQLKDSLDPGEPVPSSSTHPALLRQSSRSAPNESIEFKGLVELAPPGQWQMLDAPNGPQSESWQLDRSILPNIKQTLEATSKGIAEVADVVVDQLFADGGGMVAIDQVQLPQGFLSIEQAFVDVQVESTVMLYRSLDLFASSHHEANGVRLSGPILDAIMATLGEITESETQPITEPARFRLSGLAYPIAAVTATGVAFNARQKTKPSATHVRRTRTITH